jgi:hypothetical protein
VSSGASLLHYDADLVAGETLPVAAYSQKDRPMMGKRLCRSKIALKPFQVEWNKPIARMSTHHERFA